MFQKCMKLGRKIKMFCSKHTQRVRSFFERHSIHLSGASGVFGVLMGVGKIVSGILSLSVFTCVNGGYTLGMAAARHCAVAGTVKAEDEKGQYHYYWFAGAIMIGASLLYVAYSLWSIFHPKEVYFGDIIAITIATISFAEIGVNLNGVLKYRKSKTPLLHALKTISLGTSLISLVLTQSAILAFAGDGSNPAVNGILGTIMGGCATLLGVYMIWRINKIRKEDNQCKEDTC